MKDILCDTYLLRPKAIFPLNLLVIICPAEVRMPKIRKQKKKLKRIGKPAAGLSPAERERLKALHGKFKKISRSARSSARGHSAHVRMADGLVVRTGAKPKI